MHKILNVTIYYESIKKFLRNNEKYLSPPGLIFLLFCLINIDITDRLILVVIKLSSHF